MKHTYQEVWSTLKEIDCTEHTESKNGLTYLSWAWAWGIFMDHFPNAYYTFQKTESHSDGSQTVHVAVRIPAEHGPLERTMWLPVMDYKNKAIANPSSRDVSDSKMRCLVKCLAMFGLGHYIYAGEDLPPGNEEEQPEAPKQEAKKPEAKKPEAKKPEPKAEAPAWSEEDATKFVDTFIQTIDNFVDDKKTLKKNWSDNKKQVDEIANNYPDLYERLRNYMSKRQAFINFKDAFTGEITDDATKDKYFNEYLKKYGQEEFDLAAQKIIEQQKKKEAANG